MGSAAELFYNANPDSKSLHRGITPTVDEQEEQQERWNELAEFLKVSLNAKTGLPVQTCLQGSYKLGTQIRPWSKEEEFDIDLGVYFEWPGEPEDGDYGAKELKGFVQQALIEYHSLDESRSSSVDKPRENCGRIRFKPDFHIDVACYHLDPEKNCRSLATETWSWEERDPEGLYEWFAITNNDEAVRAKLCRQVRYLKMWSDLYSIEDEECEKPSSVMLTVLASNVLPTKAAEMDDESLFAEVVESALNYFRDFHEIHNPVKESEDLNQLSNDGCEDLRWAFEKLWDICDRARRETNKVLAAKIWAEAFLHFFPMPRDND